MRHKVSLKPKNWILYCLVKVLLVLRVGETLCEVYMIYHEIQFVGVLENSFKRPLNDNQTPTRANQARKK